MAVEDSILAGCIAGKRSAQQQLYLRFSSTMMAVCVRYAGNRQEAEDILQEGFLKVFSNISSFRKEGSLEGWIKRIMINHALNRYRKSRREPFLEDIDEINETEILDTYGETIQENIPAGELMEMIRSLPKGYRMVFNMHVFEEYGHKEIAEALGITENTSKTQLMKARRMLRKMLEEHDKIIQPARANG
jgi:RNA polymerase sigma factor (sigma-70 family)